MNNEIEKFVSEHDVDFSNDPVDAAMVKQAEKLIGINFGKELTEYLTTYGYLGFEYIQFFGMNSHQGLESDMVKQTVYLHKYFPDTASLVAFENQGEGDYYLADSNDMIFEFDTNLKNLKSTNLSVHKYILQRLKGADSN